MGLAPPILFAEGFCARVCNLFECIRVAVESFSYIFVISGIGVVLETIKMCRQLDFVEHPQTVSVGHAGDVVTDGSLQTMFGDESLEVTRH